MSTNKSDNPERVEEKGFFEELLGDVFNIDRGLPGTIFTMFKNPRLVIDSYFHDKGKYVSPFRYCILILTVVTFISVRFIDYEAMMTNALEMGAEQGGGGNVDELLVKLNTIAPNFDWAGYFAALNEITVDFLQKYNQIIYLVVLAPSMAFFSSLFFKKKQRKFISHYVMLVYGLTTFSIIGLLLIPLQTIMETANSGWVFFTGVPLIVGYLTWIMVSYLKLNGFSEILQAVIALLLGYLGHTIVSGILLYAGAYLKVIL